MRSLRSFCCLLLCVCIFCGLFSVSAYALEDDRSYFLGDPVDLNVYNPNGISTFMTLSGYEVYTLWYHSTIFYNSVILSDPVDTGHVTIRIFLPEELPRNTTFDLSLNFETTGFDVKSATVNCYNSNSSLSCDTLIADVNTDLGTIEVFDITNNKRVVNKIFIYLDLEKPVFETYSETEYNFDFSLRSINLSQIVDDELSGGILGSIKNIFNGIKNLPQNIANSIKGFFVDLGNKITDLGNAILDGIKGLFIPSEESLTEIKEDFEALLADRFGAVYESTAVIDNFANAFFNQAQVSTMSENSGTIQFPLVTVPLAGTDFSFGGWDVDIIPDGFEGIVDTLKLVVDIVCTFVFVNALRKRLEAILH